VNPRLEGRRALRIDGAGLYNGLALSQRRQNGVEHGRHSGGIGDDDMGDVGRSHDFERGALPARAVWLGCAIPGASQPARGLIAVGPDLTDDAQPENSY
jgi:hypothetical protein